LAIRPSKVNSNSANSDKTIFNLPKPLFRFGFKRRRHQLRQFDDTDLEKSHDLNDLTPLSQLNTLQTLDVSGTQVSDLTPLSQL